MAFENWKGNIVRGGCTLAAAFAVTASASALEPTTVADFDKKTTEEQGAHISDAVLEMEDYFKNKKSSPEVAQCIRGLFIESASDELSPEGITKLLGELEVARAGDPTKHHVERIILGIINQECIDK